MSNLRPDYSIMNWDNQLPFFPRDRSLEMLTLMRTEEMLQLALAGGNPDEFFADAVEAVAIDVVGMWVNITHMTFHQIGGSILRLDASLLPSPDLAIWDGMPWDEWLASKAIPLSAGEYRELMRLYAANLIPYLESELAVHPDGVVVNDGGAVLCIRKDAGGFYLLKV